MDNSAPHVSDNPALVASLFDAIAHGADDAFIVVNDQHQIVVINSAAKKMFGYGPHDSVTKRLSSLISGPIAEHHDAFVTGFGDTPATWRSMSRRPSVTARRADNTTFEAAVTIMKVRTNESTLYGAIVRDVTASTRADALLQATLTETAGVTGAEFLTKAVEVLSETLKVQTAFISICDEDNPGNNRVLASYSNGKPFDFECYEVAGTPCALATSHELLIYPTGVQELFPKDELLVELNAQSFAALQLKGSRTGDPIGHIGIMHDAYLTLTAKEISGLKVFAIRISAELDRIRADAELASQANFRNQIAAATSFGVTIRDTETGQVWNNQAYETIHHRTYAECRDLGWRNIIHPEDLDRYEAASLGVRTTGESAQISIRILRPDGEVRWLVRHAAARLNAAGNPALIVSTVVDLTDNQVAQQELEKTSAALDLRNNSLKASLSAFHDVHFWISADGIYLDIEASADTELLVQPEDLLGSHLSDWLPDKDLLATQNAIAQTLATGEVSTVHYDWFMDGVPRSFESRIAPIDGAGQVLVVVRDIGSLRDLESQVVHASTMHSVGLLAGGLAHDFNNVLHVIGGHASALARNQHDLDAQNRGIAAISRAVTRTSSLIDRLMAISRPALNNPSLTRVDHFLATLKPTLSQILGARIRLEIDLNSPLVNVLIDDIRLESAFLNLASNARDAMSDVGELKISSRIARGRFVEISISDNGSGMGRETADQVFQPFFTTKSVGVGTGLGLSTAYSTIVAAGGTVTVDSVMGEGTTFRVSLPISNLSLPSETPTGSDVPVHPKPSPTILLVEDEPDVLELCSQTLRSLGYRVRPAASGLEAMALIDSGVQIDGVLTDVAMPGLSGVELAELLRTQTPEVPVVFMSGFSSSSAGIAIPPERLLLKPFSDDSLKKMLEAHVQ